MIYYNYAGNFKPKFERLTKKQIKEIREREEFLRKNQNGKFGSIY